MLFSRRDRRLWGITAGGPLEQHGRLATRRPGIIDTFYPGFGFDYTAQSTGSGTPLA